MTRSRLFLQALVVAVISGSGCADDGAGSAHALPSWHLTETLRIGSIDGSEYPLRAISELVPLGDGSVLVGQPAATEVPQFNGNGELLRVFGRSGQGPGEFQYISNVGLLGDTVWISDHRRRSTSFFTVEGTHLRDESVTLTFLPDRPYVSPWTPRLMASEWGAMIPGIGQVNDAPNQDATLPVLKTRRSGEPIDTLQSWPLAHMLAWIDLEGVSTPVRRPVRWNLATGMSPTGQFFAILAPVARSGAEDQVRAVVTLFDHSLSLVRESELSAPAVAVPTDTLQERAAAAARLVGGGDQERAAIVQALLAAEGGMSSYPMADAVLVDDRGEVWVQRGYPQESGRTWWILDDRSEPIATLQVPPRVELKAIEEDAAWGVYRDELDVPYVVRYSVARQ